MDGSEPLVPRYVAILARYVCSDDAIERESALTDATELAKAALPGGPQLDRLHELHSRAQAELADRWRDAAPGSAEQCARERLVRGEALAPLLALVLPHELAEQARHEQRWRREHETQLAMFEQTDDLIVVFDAQGRCDDVNPAFRRATGWTRREAIDGAAAWSEPPAGTAPQRRRTRQARRDGTLFTIEWSVSPILTRGGELHSHVCVGRDVDRQQRVDDGLRENDKLRAVATLAGGIAHDFNNLLGSILGLAELCELEAAPESRQARNLARIRQAGGKAAVLVRQMLDFSRQAPPNLERTTAGAWLAHAHGLLRATLPRHLALGVEVLEDAPVRIDLVQMEQVLMNLVRNAAQAMQERGSAVRVVADRAEPASPLAPGRHLRVRIVDDGCGIAPDVLDKIFEPFFTTKPVGEGTGLGLSAAHGIVAAHGGTIEVESEPSLGTTFGIFLPMAAAD